MTGANDVGRRGVRSLLSLAVVYTLLVVSSVAVIALFRRGAGMNGILPLDPFGPPDASRVFFSTNQAATRASAFLCFVSAIPLAVYAAMLVARLELLDVRHAGIYVAFAGGLGASAGLAATGLALWLLSVPEVVASVPVARALHFFAFLCGGPAFAAGMGLLAGGVSVSSRTARLLPIWVVRLGVLLAVTGALSTVGLLSMTMTIAIPITRGGGFIWLIATGAMVRDGRRIHRAE